MITPKDNELLKSALLQRLAQSGVPYSANLAAELAAGFALLNQHTDWDCEKSYSHHQIAAD